MVISVKTLGDLEAIFTFLWTKKLLPFADNSQIYIKAEIENTKNIPSQKGRKAEPWEKYLSSSSADQQDSR